MYKNVYDGALTVGTFTVYESLRTPVHNISTCAKNFCHCGNPATKNKSSLPSLSLSENENDVELRFVLLRAMKGLSHLES